MDKHSSLLRKLINYGEKKFYNIGPRMPPCILTSSRRILRIMTLCKIVFRGMTSFSVLLYIMTFMRETIGMITIQNEMPAFIFSHPVYINLCTQCCTHHCATECRIAESYCAKCHFLNVLLQSVILPSVIILFHSAECYSGECHSGECHSGQCHSGECHSGECHSGECHSGACHSGECHSATGSLCCVSF